MLLLSVLKFAYKSEPTILVATGATKSGPTNSVEILNHPEDEECIAQFPLPMDSAVGTIIYGRPTICGSTPG